MAGEKEGMPTWEPAPAELVREFGDMVRPLPGVEVRKMFGYPCAWINGQMFAGLFASSMFLRLSEEDRERFLDLEGASRFEPMPGRLMREYVVVPQGMLGQRAELSDWLQWALQYAAALPPKDAKKSDRSRTRKSGGG